MSCQIQKKLYNEWYNFFVISLTILTFFMFLARLNKIEVSMNFQKVTLRSPSTLQVLYQKIINV